MALTLVPAAAYPADAPATQPADFINGYTDRTSYAPGEVVTFHVSTNLPVYNVRVARIGAEKEFVWERAKLAGAEHPVPADASARGCGWPEAFTLTIAPEWRSGYYEVYTGAEDPRHDKHCQGVMIAVGKISCRFTGRCEVAVRPSVSP